VIHQLLLSTRHSTSVNNSAAFNCSTITIICIWFYVSSRARYIIHTTRRNMLTSETPMILWCRKRGDSGRRSISIYFYISLTLYNLYNFSLSLSLSLSHSQSHSLRSRILCVYTRNKRSY